jgi:hypothetical protein
MQPTNILIVILTFVFVVMGVVWAIRSYNNSTAANQMMKTSIQLDWLEYCRGLEVAETPVCQHHLNNLYVLIYHYLWAG